MRRSVSEAEFLPDVLRNRYADDVVFVIIGWNIPEVRSKVDDTLGKAATYLRENNSKIGQLRRPNVSCPRAENP